MIVPTGYNASVIVRCLKRLCWPASWFLLISGQIWWLGWEPVDDAYISFRYARNWAEGHGLVYNIGERVEGYTNFLWTAVLAGSYQCSGDLPRTSVALGICLAVLCLHLTYLQAQAVLRERDLPSAWAWLAPFALCVYPGWSLWAASGMEGMLLCSLVLAAIHITLIARSPGWLILAGGLIGLAAMTRWEAGLLGGVLCAAAFLRSEIAGGGARRVLCIALPALTIFGAYYTFRYSYYNDPFPNTFYAKTALVAWRRLPHGVIYCGEMGLSWLVPLTAMTWFHRFKGQVSATLTVYLFIHCIYVTWTGGDFFPWLRFFLPVLPIVAIMLCVFVLRSAYLLRLRPAFMAISVCAALAAISYKLDYESAIGHQRWLADWKVIGRWAQQQQPESQQIAIAPIGMIGYTSNRPVLDLLGLVDYQTAHNGVLDSMEPVGHQVSYSEYVVQRHPEVVLGQGIVSSEVLPEAQVIARSCRKSAVIALVQRSDFQALYHYEPVPFEGRWIALWRLKTK